MKYVPNVPKNPYSEVEFDEFIKHIGNANIYTWSVLAEILGVNRRTVSRWKKHPIARQAIARAINKSIGKMEKAGKKDWKMWREKLKMLGVKDRQVYKYDLNGNSVSNSLDCLEKSDYGELGSQAKRALEAFK